MINNELITASDQNRIRAWHDRQSGEISLYLTQSSHPEQAAFDAFGKTLSELAPCVRIRPWEKETDLPGFVLADNIMYAALPLEKELAPFLEGLTRIWEKPGAQPPEIRALLDQVDMACDLTLYIALQCPHCPGMVASLIPLAAASEKIRLTLIDGTLFPDIAQKDDVMAAPCLILDHGFRWTGHVETREVLTMIIDRDPSGLSAGTLKTILEQGDAGWISDAMIRSDTIYKGFVQLLLHPTWSVRLGAMVVVETLRDDAPDLAAKLCPILEAVFHEKEIPVQGDILYALGEAGTLETMAWIREIHPRLEHPDLREAAEDALEAIESRGW